MKNGEIIKKINALKALDQLKTDDVEVVFAIACDLNRLEAARKDFETATVSLLKKHAALDEAGNVKTVAAEGGIRKYDFLSTGDEKKFVELANKLTDEDASVKLMRFKTSQLKKVKGITGAIINDLMDIIDDDDNSFPVPDAAPTKAPLAVVEDAPEKIEK